MAELAAMPDDASTVDAALNTLIQLVVATIPAVDYASSTARIAGKPSTVAFSSELAVAVDQSQYDEDAGPCIDAADGTVTSVDDVTTVMEWPRFREAATKMGLGSSLSIPLFTASGDPSMGMNLYAREPRVLTPLAHAVATAFHPADGPTNGNPDASFDEGSRDFLRGLSRALGIRDEIQRGIGIVMAREQITAAGGYTRLRVEAAEADSSILDHAKSLIERREVET